MICCIQRVSKASVSVDNRDVGEINKGLLVLFGVEKGDEEIYINWATDKILNMRIFQDDEGKMSKSLIDIGGSILIVSQFTLAGVCTKGRRPDFTNAESPHRAELFYNKFIDRVGDVIGHEKVSCGIFGAHMEVSLVNEGPVTILLEKRK